MAHKNHSEIAHLRRQIELEVLAMHSGLSGLAAGTAKHQFLQRKMDRIGDYQHQLAGHIGDEEANQICCQTYIQAMEKT